MVKFSGLLLLVGTAALLAAVMHGSGFAAIALLAVLVGVYCIVLTFLNEIRRTLN